MADRDSGLDPRYAAQFQRGYAGPPLPRKAPSERVPAANPSTPTQPERTPADPQPPKLQPAAPAQPLAASRTERQESVDAAEPDDTVDRSAGFREWGLLGAGVVLFVLAVGLFWVAATDTSLYSALWPSDRYVFIETRNRLPGPLLVGSILAVSTWVVMRALGSRRAGGSR